MPAGAHDELKIVDYEEGRLPRRLSAVTMRKI
jgi:hypothetical protein